MVWGTNARHYIDLPVLLWSVSVYSGVPDPLFRFGLPPFLLVTFRRFDPGEKSGFIRKRPTKHPSNLVCIFKVAFLCLLSFFGRKKRKQAKDQLPGYARHAKRRTFERAQISPQRGHPKSRGLPCCQIIFFHKKKVRCRFLQQSTFAHFL